MQKANEKYKGSMLAVIHNDLNLINEISFLLAMNAMESAVCLRPECSGV